MPKVANFREPDTAFFNKLAQLSPDSCESRSREPGNSDINKLKKRAKAKYFTMAYLRHLIDLDSPLKKSYVNTVFCCRTLHQDGDKITAQYCNNRWCIVCNRIRIGKAINGYLPQLKALKEPYFVTLTVPNVKGSDLRGTITGMTKTWRLLYQCLKKRHIDVVGIRKTECTYNPVRDDYHPHFHMIVDGKDLAAIIHDEWLQRNPNAIWKAQDIRPADEGSMLELFKYFTKLITKEALYIPALDTIFQAMAGLRVFQPFGILKVSEDVEDIVAEVIEDLERKEVFWEWLHHDWVDMDTDQCLSGFEPTHAMEKLLQNIVC